MFIINDSHASVNPALVIVCADRDVFNSTPNSAWFFYSFYCAASFIFTGAISVVIPLCVTGFVDIRNKISNVPEALFPYHFADGYNYSYRSARGNYQICFKNVLLLMFVYFLSSVFRYLFMYVCFSIVDDNALN